MIWRNVPIPRLIWILLLEQKVILGLKMEDWSWWLEKTLSTWIDSVGMWSEGWRCDWWRRIEMIWIASKLEQIQRGSAAESQEEKRKPWSLSMAIWLELDWRARLVFHKDLFPHPHLLPSFSQDWIAESFLWSWRLNWNSNRSCKWTSRSRNKVGFQDKNSSASSIHIHIPFFLLFTTSTQSTIEYHDILLSDRSNTITRHFLRSSTRSALYNLPTSRSTHSLHLHQIPR